MEEGAKLEFISKTKQWANEGMTERACSLGTRINICACWHVGVKWVGGILTYWMLLLVKYAKDIYTYIYIYFYMEENEKSSQDPAQLAHTKLLFLSMVQEVWSERAKSYLPKLWKSKHQKIKAKRRRDTNTTEPLIQIICIGLTEREINKNPPFGLVSIIHINLEKEKVEESLSS